MFVIVVVNAGARCSDRDVEFERDKRKTQNRTAAQGQRKTKK